jgi:hypothetical protein
LWFAQCWMMAQQIITHGGCPHLYGVRPPPPPLQRRLQLCVARRWFELLSPTRKEEKREGSSPPCGPMCRGNVAPQGLPRGHGKFTMAKLTGGRHQGAARRKLGRPRRKLPGQAVVP